MSYMYIILYIFRKKMPSSRLRKELKTSSPYFCCCKHARQYQENHSHYFSLWAHSCSIRGVHILLCVLIFLFLRAFPFFGDTLISLSKTTYIKKEHFFLKCAELNTLKYTFKEVPTTNNLRRQFLGLLGSRLRNQMTCNDPMNYVKTFSVKIHFIRSMQKSIELYKRNLILIKICVITI